MGVGWAQFVLCMAKSSSLSTITAQTAHTASLRPRPSGKLSAAWMVALSPRTEKAPPANSVKIDIVGGKLQWAKTITHKNADGDWPSCTFGSITCSADIGANAKLLLQALGMMPYSSSDLCAGHTCWFRNSDEERAFFSGCSWHNPSHGLGSFDGFTPRPAWAMISVSAPLTANCRL